jgi:hypothetical protein
MKKLIVRSSQVEVIYQERAITVIQFWWAKGLWIIQEEINRRIIQKIVKREFL